MSFESRVAFFTVTLLVTISFSPPAGAAPKLRVLSLVTDLHEDEPPAIPDSGGVVCANLVAVSEPSANCQWVIPQPDPLAFCECGKGIYSQEEILQATELIATRSIAGGFDIVALQEVLDEEARLDLSSRLAAAYPHQVILAKDSGDGFSTHSGLMLFLKDGLEMVNEPRLLECGGTDNAFGGWDPADPADTEVVGSGSAVFREFFENTGYDSWADKGVIYVRVHDIANNRFYNVFTTHLQGSYNSEWEEEQLSYNEIESVIVRETQLEEIRVLRECLIGRGIVVPNEVTLLVGDLNIDGNLQNTTIDWSMTPVDNRAEHAAYFSNIGEDGNVDDYFWDNLMDGWSNLMPVSLPTSDPLLTCYNHDCLSTKDGCRLDYVVTNDLRDMIDGKLCVQHITKAVNINGTDTLNGKPVKGGLNENTSIGADGRARRGPATVWHSEHTGIEVDLNVLDFHCSPLDPAAAQTMYGNASFGAYELAAAELGVDAAGCAAGAGKMIAGSLPESGSVQWFKITHAGQYLIGVRDSDEPKGFEIQVFHHSDFTWPELGYRGEKFTKSIGVAGQGSNKIVGMKYALLDPPYYLKIYNRTGATGSYRYAASRLTCTNKGEEACMLLPNEPNDACYRFRAGTPVDSFPTANCFYFQADIQSVGGAPQNLRYIAYDYLKGVAGGGSKLTQAIVGTANDATLSAMENLNNADRFAANGYHIGSNAAGDCPAATHLGVNGPNYRGCNNVIDWMNYVVPAGAQPDRRFMKICAPTIASDVTDITFKPMFWTNVTAFGGKEIRADLGGLQLASLADADDSPRDEMLARFKIDDTNWGSGVDPSYYVTSNGGDCPQYEGAIWLGYLDEDCNEDAACTLYDLEGKIDGVTLSAIGPKLPYLFASNLEIQLLEDNDESCSAPWDYQGPGRSGVSPLPWGHTARRSGALRRLADHIQVGGGVYDFAYNLAHGSQWLEPPHAVTNIAKQASISQSSTYPGSVCPTVSCIAARAVDGSNSTFMKTNSGMADPWWRARFSSGRFVERVEVFGNVSATMSNFIVEFTEANNAITYMTYSGSLPTNGSASFPFGKMTKSIRIKKSGMTEIATKEVKIFGY
jgi:hypothetical protein